MQIQEFLANAWPGALLALVLVVSIDHYWNTYMFWPRHGIKGDQPLLPVLSDAWNFFTKCQMALCVERTKKFGKIYGTFFLGSKRLMINDPEIIRQILIKDFDLFPDHELNPWANDYQRNQLVWIQGDHWRRVRALMSPSFTSAKMRRMYNLMLGCADDLVECLREQYIRARRDGQPWPIVDLVQLYSMYTMDGITTCCYGIKLLRQRTINVKALRHKSAASSRDSFIEDLNLMLKPKFHRLLSTALVPQFILRWLGFRIVPEHVLQPVVERVQKMVELRRKGERNKYDDLLQSLVDASFDDQLELDQMDQQDNHHAGLTKESLEQDQAKLKALLTKRKHSLKGTLSDFEILAEAMLLLGAGLETTRSSLSSITYFLAHNQPVQQRLFEELKSIVSYTLTALGEHLVFDYEALTSCQYLDAVVSEGLRIFTPALFTDRQVNQDYHIGKYNITAPKGVRMLMGFHSVHMDPDYWSEPEKFDPERFMPGRKEKIVPGSYAPFSLGPRHCIGMRFSLMETKLGLAKLMMNFKFEPAPDTKYPPVPNRTFGLVSIKNCKVKVLLRED